MWQGLLQFACKRTYPVRYGQFVAPCDNQTTDHVLCAPTSDKAVLGRVLPAIPQSFSYFAAPVGTVHWNSFLGKEDASLHVTQIRFRLCPRRRENCRITQ